MGEIVVDAAGAASGASVSDEYERLSKLVASTHERTAKRRHAVGIALRWLVRLGTLLTMAALAGIVGYILIMGVPRLTPSLFEWEYNSVNVSLMPALINTVLMAFLSLLIAVPISVWSAIYLVEYAGRGNRFVKLVSVTTETLAGIPSIVYGLFGMLFFVTALHWGMSLLAGACTLAIMILPIIMRTSQEALLAVPDDYRMGSFGLGAGRLRTVAKVVLPSAIPGILGGVILGLGRVVEEVAALLFTCGSVAAVPDFAGQGLGAVFSSTRTLAEHMYLLASEGLHINETYATAVVLLALVVALNAVSTYFANRLARNATGED